jgi:membrane-associated protease RseP (regulator of RpoE activity)
LSSQGHLPASNPLEDVNGKGNLARIWEGRVRKQKYWLHLLLFALTVVTITWCGAYFADNFAHNRPAVDLQQDFQFPPAGLSHLRWWLGGLPFSLTLLTILLAHEFGHYLACMHYGIDASLPYFLPFPSVIGTLGAFIRIRSPIYSRRALFDVGIAGPLAGFAFILPALGIGLACSKVIPGIAHKGDLFFGTPILFRLVGYLFYPGVPHVDIALHPVARAAWVGVFSTGMNLLPIGQLDGGHIVYASASRYHRLVSRIFVALLVPLGFLYWPWLMWAAILFFFGMKHPTVYDESDLGPGRRKLAWVALAVFVLCFMLAPIETAEGL